MPCPRPRGQTHTEEPAAAAAHVHLPVVAARGEALPAQDARLLREPLRVGRRWAWRRPAGGHAFAILGNLQAGVGGARIQGHIHCAKAQGQCLPDSAPTHTPSPPLLGKPPVLPKEKSVE